jgi:peroxiredoxin (alkyl hydroperoxide reductase subunit C)
LGKIDYPLVADLTKNISRDYGVLLEDKGIAARGTFIIDGDGIVQNASVQGLNVGRNVDEVLRLLNAYQHNASTGHVCPMGWAKDKDDIDPDKAPEYFEKNG